MKLKGFALIVAVTVLVCSFVVTADAAEAMTMTIGNVSAARGETVTVDVTLANNPGFCVASLEIQYDTSRLVLKDAALGEEFAKGALVSYENLPYLTFVNSRNVTAAEFLTMTFEVTSSASFGDAEITLAIDEGNLSNMDEQDVGFSVVSGKVAVRDTAENTTAKTAKTSSDSTTSGKNVPITEKSTSRVSASTTRAASTRGATSMSVPGIQQDGIYGDANDDDAVNMKDVLVMRKFMAGLPVEINVVAADVNDDDVVNMKDVLTVRKFIAGLTEHL